MLPIPLVEILETMRLVACPICGAMHALPLAAFIAATRDQKPIHCHAGHAWTPLADDADRRSNADQSRVEMIATMADLQLKLSAAQARILELGPPSEGPLTAKEIRRRCHVVASRADAVPGGTRHRSETDALCSFCGKAMSRGYLPKHIRRQHTEEISKKPASFFDAAAQRLLARLD